MPTKEQKFGSAQVVRSDDANYGGCLDAPPIRVTMMSTP
jgi:hypothetical protein